MSQYRETCKKCGAKLIIDDGECYAGGLRDYEIVSCPDCGNKLEPVYTSGNPSVTHDLSSDK